MFTTRGFLNDFHSLRCSITSIQILNDSSQSSCTLSKLKNIYNFFQQDIILKQPPFILYSEAKKGNFVINNATVTATLHEVNTGSQIIFPLFDNGDGGKYYTLNKSHNMHAYKHLTFLPRNAFELKEICKKT